MTFERTEHIHQELDPERRASFDQLDLDRDPHMPFKRIPVCA